MSYQLEHTPEALDDLKRLFHFWKNVINRAFLARVKLWSAHSFCYATSLGVAVDRPRLTIPAPGS